MKRILLPFVSALIASNIFAAPIPYDDAKKPGELVAVLCHSRGKDIHHLKPNWYEGSIWQPEPEKRGKFANVRVMIAKKDLEAFKSIPTAAFGDAIILQGRVEDDVEAHFSFLRLVSRNAVP